MHEKDSGKIEELPYSLRKTIYDEFIKIDLKEHRDYIKRLRGEGKESYTAGYESDVPGLTFMIGPSGGCEEVIILMNMLIQETGQKKVMALKFRIGEESKLLESAGTNEKH